MRHPQLKVLTKRRKHRTRWMIVDNVIRVISCVIRERLVS